MKLLVLLSALLLSVSASAFNIKIENKTEGSVTAQLTIYDTHENFLKDLGYITVASTQVYVGAYSGTPSSERYLVRWSVVGKDGAPLCYEGQFPVMGSETFLVSVTGYQEHHMAGCSVGRY